MGYKRTNMNVLLVSPRGPCTGSSSTPGKFLYWARSSRDDTDVPHFSIRQGSDTRALRSTSTAGFRVDMISVEFYVTRYKTKFILFLGFLFSLQSHRCLAECCIEMASSDACTNINGISSVVDTRATALARLLLRVIRSFVWKGSHAYELERRVLDGDGRVF